MVFGKKVTKSQVVTKSNVTKSRLHCTSKEPNCTARVCIATCPTYVKLPGIGLVNNVLDKSFV